jgi:rSAM-associated Gly-rich repeat protein
LNIKTQMGWASFLVALSAFNSPVEAAIAPPIDQTTPTEISQPSIEGRLTRISATLKAKESQLPDNASETPANGDIAIGWVNGRGGGSFVNRRGGGGWGNGWRDGGGFFNSRPWGNGGFLNSPGWRNGGFVNRF